MHEAVKRYIEGLSHGHTPSILMDNQVLYGATTLTVKPTLEADCVDSLRLEIPQGRPGIETFMFMHFFIAVTGLDKFVEILPRLQEFMHKGGEFNEVVERWQIQI